VYIPSGLQHSVPACRMSLSAAAHSFCASSRCTVKDPSSARRASRSIVGHQLPRTMRWVMAASWRAVKAGRKSCWGPAVRLTCGRDEQGTGLSYVELTKDIDGRGSIPFHTHWSKACQSFSGSRCSLFRWLNVLLLLEFNVFGFDHHSQIATPSMPRAPREPSAMKLHPLGRAQHRTSKVTPSTLGKP
jgi:hypothetical protein